MSGFSYYLTEVLGVKNYLCPRDIYSCRRLSGPLSCDILVVTEGALNEESFQLIKKIMGAVQVSDFSLLEIKDISREREIRSFFLRKNTAGKTLVFGEKLSSLSPDSPSVLTSCHLKNLLEGPHAKENKRRLWSRLQEWISPKRFAPSLKPAPGQGSHSV